MRQVCPHCGAPLYHKVCEYCGMPAKQPTASAGTKSRKFVWLAIALAAAVLLGVVGVTSVAVKRIHSGVSTVLAGKSENSTNDAAALKKMQDSGVFPSGTYLVGEEIPAGEYILVSSPQKQIICSMPASMPTGKKSRRSAEAGTSFPSLCSWKKAHISAFPGRTAMM